MSKEFVEVIGLLLLVMLVSAVTALSVFTVAWLFWLRSLQKSVSETQQTLKDVKSSFEKLVSFQQTMMGTPPPVPLMGEDGDGDFIESDVDGMIIRLPPDVSPQERERIIHYLKSEGFISDES